MAAAASGNSARVEREGLGRGKEAAAATGGGGWLSHERWDTAAELPNRGVSRGAVAQKRGAKRQQRWSMADGLACHPCTGVKGCGMDCCMAATLGHVRKLSEPSPPSPPLSLPSPCCSCGLGTEDRGSWLCKGEGATAEEGA